MWAKILLRVRKQPEVAQGGVNRLKLAHVGRIACDARSVAGGGWRPGRGRGWGRRLDRRALDTPEPNGG
jgi:hypothetical protein